MSSPAKKKRKLAGTVAPPKNGKDLRYFFGKKAVDTKAEDGLKGKVDSVKNVDIKTPDGDNTMTDEEYARQLDAALNGGNGSSTMQWNGSSGAKKDEAEEEELHGIEVLVDIDGKNTKAESSPSLKRKKPPSPSEPQLSSSQSSTKGAALSSANPSSITEPSVDTVDITKIPFDTDPFAFDPSAYRTPVTYALLVRALILASSTRSRIKIVDTLTNLLRTIILSDPSSLLSAVWLLTNDIAPPYDGIELGIGGSILTKAIVRTSGVTAAQVKALYNRLGDAGDVAFEAKCRQRTLALKKPAPLTVKGVYDALRKIAAAKGQGSQEAKQRVIERLLVDAKGEEVRYLVRTLVQHLRIGAVKTTMLIALSRAFSLTKPEDAKWELPEVGSGAKAPETVAVFSKAEDAVKQCFARCPNYNELVPALLRAGTEGLRVECPMRIHVPLKPMLGSITRDLSEMLLKLPGREFACEYKYDGQRAQIHCDSSGKVSIFSRHLELMTDKYPDLVALVPQIRGDNVESFIMEGEVVAIDPVTGALKNFQTLAGRGRKDVQLHDVSVDVCIFAFDLMYLNGEELLQRSFRERRDLLRSLFIEVPGKFTWVKSIDAGSGDDEMIQEFFRSALDEKCEGIMVKVLDNPAITIDDPPPAPTTSTVGKKDKIDKKSTRRKALLSTYEPDKRLESWLKVKKDYDAAADSLDLIPIGGWHGNGRKSKWWSPILLAVRNEETGGLDAVCKCMSGFTDAFYKANREKYRTEEDLEEAGDAAEDLPLNTTRVKPTEISSTLTPEVWFLPQEVWEVKFGDITLSPTYTAGMGLVDEDRGMSLRFPRFIRVREDKGLEEASTGGMLAELWRRQEERAKKEGRESASAGGPGDEVAEEEEEEDVVGGVDDGFEM